MQDLSGRVAVITERAAQRPHVQAEAVVQDALGLGREERAHARAHGHRIERRRHVAGAPRRQHRPPETERRARGAFGSNMGAARPGERC